MRNRVVACLVACIAYVACSSPSSTARDSTGHAVLSADEVPTFWLRARVLSAGGQPPVGRTFTFRFEVPSAVVNATGEAWSDWVQFGRSQVEAALARYPNLYLRAYPVVTKLLVTGVVDPTELEVETWLDETGESATATANLYASPLGILTWRDAGGEPHASTMAEYNRRYWERLADLDFPEALRPRQFPIVERMIGGDGDRADWGGGIQSLVRAGFSGIMLPPTGQIRDLLLETSVRRTAWAVYNPPGYAFDYDAAVTEQAIETWANAQVQPYLNAGYDREDMALFAMSDEPGWYYPRMFQSLAQNPVALVRFHDYLAGQGLEPADVGASIWAEVLPLGRSQAIDLASRRLFYWTMRFYAWDSARHFARCAATLESAFYAGLPIFTNWNFFSGRFYVPGPVANNPDRMDPDAAMGGHDWLEFGRMRGSTILWTEDWFADSMAYQWSFYAAKLHSAARASGVPFGGYVVGRTAGDREGGILQKVLTLVGSGGKGLKYYTFGPEYNFPGNCYSERAGLLRKIAEANRMVGAAEDLLWPGQRAPAQVGILMPRSAQPWDARGVPLPTMIQDATNNQLNRQTVDYMAEVFDLYLALQHANIPVEFVDEDDLHAAGLAQFRVLYVTEPNVPVEGQYGMIDWVRAGGTLVTVSGAAARDRYDDATTVFGDLTGIYEEPRERLLVENAAALPVAAQGDGRFGSFTAIAVRGTVKAPSAQIEATFADGAPATVLVPLDQGRVVHFAWLPGLSYWRSSTGTRDRLPIGFSEAIRNALVYPVELAGVAPPIGASEPMVETPVLLSAGGAAITLLNWTGQAIPELVITARVPFDAATVTSVTQGNLMFVLVPGGVQFSLPLGAADVVTVRP